ncbi:MAG: FKBP-type peptidyl-prolyl cis-trans isomerase [Deltaproteobacteria bacterium]|nr:FKBP-type peptidyl-prolyl cis-trans isomerase [Deltaproteobacteria bacterium]
MLIGPGTIVTMTYAVRDETGEVLDDIYLKSPVKFAFGDKRFPRGLTAALAGLSDGDAKNVTLAPGKAFGERREDAVIRIKAGELPTPPTARGELFSRLSDTGEREVFTVLGFVGDRVILDPNHPWAGKTLTYDIRVIAVEPVNREPAAINPIMEG